ncbi:MAG: SIP domain-containing protein [Desertimonas sp.]
MTQDTPVDQGEPRTDPIADYMTLVGAEIIQHLHDEHEDSLTFIGRVLGKRPTATRVIVERIDGRGLDAQITDDDGTHAVRVDFAHEVTDPMALTASLLGLAVQAREQSDERGQTSAERTLAEMAGIGTFLTSVTAVEDIHPHLRKVTLAGGDLTSFVPLGPDTFVYVLLPPPGRDRLTVDRSFTWEQFGQMPPSEQPVGGYYTVYDWRPADAEVDMLFVLHGEGNASGWATRAGPGDPVALWGPRSGYHPPEGTDWQLLVADETGLPAVARILKDLPEGTPALVVAEVADADEHHPLPTRSDIEVTWLHRDGADAGTTTLLVDAVRAMDWRSGAPYVWGGGESRAMTAVRRHVRDERGLERAAVSLVGYWRHDG